MDPLDPHTCYRALQTRDARFDGRFFVAVSTTGIYCRPICPARTARFDNCSFFPSAAAAQSYGFRPCLRCRPETAPGRGAWLGTFNTVSRALRLIEDGALDDDAATVDALAARLGVGERHLRRLFQVHLGASPVAVAQTRRVLFAKQLLQDTSLPMADVAMAAGFGSVRRFNEVFQSLYQQVPSQLRTARLRAREPDGIENLRGLCVQVPYRQPYDVSALLRFLATRAIEGVEHVAGDTYQRTLWQDGAAGVVSVQAEPGKALLKVTVQHPSIRVLPAILARVRRVFDVDADIQRIHAHLSQDPFMAGLVQSRPGLRAPGGWDGFELAVRAVLGQQVTVAAARRLAAKLVQICGTRLAVQAGGLSHCFPTAEQVLAADLSTLGMPGSRKNALKALAQATLADRDLFCISDSIDDTVKRLCAIKGIGEWTAHYIALRAVRETDAFPASDVGLLRSMAVNGERPSPAQLLSRAEAWRPWRAYAAQHLWAADPDFFGQLTMHICYAEQPSPMGSLHLLWDAQQHLLALEFADRRERMQTLLSRQYREELVISTTAVPAPIAAALAAYFDGEISALTALPVHHGGTTFQQTVWHALRDIPAGQTLSYGALAQRIGNPAAVRAVGLANGANPVGIVVPCHRVIGANGQLTGYGGGLDRKRWLLDHEARHAPAGGQLF